MFTVLAIDTLEITSKNYVCVYFTDQIKCRPNIREIRELWVSGEIYAPVILVAVSWFGDDLNNNNIDNYYNYLKIDNNIYVYLS